MRLVPLLLAFVLFGAILPPTARGAERHASISCPSCDHQPVDWAARHPVQTARIAITTTNRAITLLLTDDVVAMQLSDRAFHEVTRELHKDADEDDDDGILGQAIRTAVIASVSAMLDHSAECPLRDLRDVSYANGRLVLTARDGRHLYEDAETDDEDVLASFTERDALAFVQEFRRVKAARR